MKIRRPLYFIGFSCAAAILIHHYFGVTVAGCLVVMLALTCLFALRRQGAVSLYPGTKDGKGAVPLPPIITGGFRAGSRGLTLLLLITAGFAGGLTSLCISDYRLTQDPFPVFAEEKVTITARVIDPEKKKNSKGEDVWKIEAEAVRIKETADLQVKETAELQTNKTAVSQDDKAAITDEEITGRILITAPAAAAPIEALLPGSLIRCSGEVKLPQTKRNPNCFDYRLYLRTYGIQTTLYTENIDQVCIQSDEMTGQPQTIRARLFLMRERYPARISEHAGPETAAMIRAILFGEKGQLSDDVQELFQKNGTAHILAVSGLHVGMIYAALTGLWEILSKWFPFLFGVRRGKRFFICTAVFFYGYAFLAGYAPSVVRAVIMVLLHSFAGMTGRRYDLNCAAFAVGTWAMLHNPYVLLQAGFQMSFLAIITLGLITPYINRFYTGALVGSMAIQIGLGPYILYQFNVLSLAAVFINVPVIMLAGVLVPAALAGMVLPFGTGLWDMGLACLCRMLVSLNELCCIDHVSTLTVASPPLWIIAGFYLGMFVFASEEGRLMLLRGRRSAALAIAAAVFLAAVSLGQAADDGFRRAELVFVDVGQGDCMHIRSSGRNFLIDGGGSHDYEVGVKTLEPYLLKNGVSRVDAAFVTHLHTDHYKGICELAKAGLIGRIYVYESNRLKIKQICDDTGLAEDRISFLHAGQSVQLGEGGDSLEVLWPKAKSDSEYQQMIENEEDENASSLIMRARIEGVSLLATGDLGEDGEAELLNEYGSGWARIEPIGSERNPLRADILKVGHHGSKTSSSEEFLDAVRPAFAVIQVGMNNMYGHPTPEVLDRLQARSTPVWRNDLQGAIGMELRNGRLLEVKTVLPQPAAVKKN